MPKINVIASIFNFLHSDCIFCSAPKYAAFAKRGY